MSHFVSKLTQRSAVIEKAVVASLVEKTAYIVRILEIVFGGGYSRLDWF